MQAADILTVDYVVETSGVQTVFGQHWKVVSFAGPDGDAQIILDLVTAFWNAVKQTMSDTTVFSCAKMINITTPAKEIVFPGLAGDLVDKPHPPHQAIRIEQYGRTNAALPYVRNANNLAGIAQQFSDRGRFTDESELAATLTHFSSDTVSGPNGATLRPVVRETVDKGEPSDPGPFVAPTYAYHDVAVARLNEVFRTIRSRKFELCV